MQRHILNIIQYVMLLLLYAHESVYEKCMYRQSCSSIVVASQSLILFSYISIVQLERQSVSLVGYIYIYRSMHLMYMCTQMLFVWSVPEPTHTPVSFVTAFSGMGVVKLLIPFPFTFWCALFTFKSV